MNITQQLSTSAILLAIVAAGANRLEAAPIAWDSVGLITNDSDVKLEGTLLQAVNVSGVDTTINTVLFAATSAAGAGNLVLSASGPMSGEGSSYGVGTPFTDLSSSYQALAQSGRYAWNVDMNLGISGLTSGKQYLVQFWVNDSRSFINRDVTLTATNTSDPLKYNNTAGSNGLGSYVVGRFTADAATQNIVASSGPSGYPQINGYQIREIPEPASLALLVLGAAALLRRRRS